MPLLTQNGSNCGFSPLQKRALLETFESESTGASLTANQTFTGNNTFSTGTTQTNTLKIGASGTVGAFNVFPSTAAKGSIRILAADSAGDTVTTITNASQAGARTYTIPDAGGAASFVMTAGTQTLAGTTTISGATTLSGATSVTGALTHGGVVPASATFTPAAGASNICLVTIQLKDAAGTNLATSRMIDIWLSDAATGIGLTATTASGAVAAGASGTDIFTYTSKKHLKVQTTAAGLYILSITDTSKTGFYVCAQLSGAGNNQVSAQLVTGDYGA